MSETTYDPVKDGQTLNALKHSIRAVTNEVMQFVLQYPPSQERHEVIHEIEVLLSELKRHNLAPIPPDHCEICGDHDCSNCGFCHNRDANGQRCEAFIAPGTDCPAYSVDLEDDDLEWSAAAH